MRGLRLLGGLLAVFAAVWGGAALADFEQEDIVCETTTATGTGRVTIDLSGTPCANYLTFATGGVDSGDVVTYTMVSGDNKIETGYATFTNAAPDTLTSFTVLASSDGVATALNLTGTTFVYLQWNSHSFSGGVLGVSFLNVDVAGTTVPVNGIYEPSANVLGFAVNTTAEMQLSATALYPATSNGNALGSTTNMWADAFLAAGGVIDWNNGQATITESAGALLFEAGPFAFGGNITPDVNDGGALGTTSLKWADAFLADGGVLDWGSGGVSITHAAASDSLIFALDAANALSSTSVSFQLDGATELDLSSTGLNPGANDGLALGTSSLSYADLYLAEGAVINYDNGDCVITQTGNSIDYAGCRIDGESLNRPGEFFWYSNATCPAYSLPTDGAAVSRTTYADLFAVTSTTFGAGNGSTTFNVPNTDTDNRFIRAADGTTITIATTQTHQLQSHSHLQTVAEGTSNAQNGTSNRADNTNEQTSTTGTTGNFGTETRPNALALRGCIAF